MTVAARDPAAWSTAREAVTVCCQRVVLRRTSRIALVVGTILSAVNQGGVLLGGHASGMTWLRVAANYIIPFCVSNAGVLSGTRTSTGHRTGTAPLPEGTGTIETPEQSHHGDTTARNCSSDGTPSGPSGVG